MFEFTKLRAYPPFPPLSCRYVFWKGEGEGVIIKFDDMSLAEKDMVKIVGRQYAAHKITAPSRLIQLTQPGS